MWSRIWESWRYISNREHKIKKRLQKITEIIIRNSKVSMKKYIKNLNRLKNFIKGFRSFCFMWSTVMKRSI